MRILFAYISLFLFTVVMTGCEGSYYPMSDPLDSTVEEHFTGSWMIDAPAGEERSYLNILPFNEHEYYVEVWDESEEDDLIRMGVFSTELNGVWYANVRCLVCDIEDGRYYFFRYDYEESGRLEVRGIHDTAYDEIRLLGSTEAVRAYMSDHMAESDFFEEESGVYVKLDEWIWPWETIESEMTSESMK